MAIHPVTRLNDFCMHFGLPELSEQRKVNKRKEP